MREAVREMKVSANHLRQGRISIGECESDLNRIIDNATTDISELDEKIRVTRILKRKEWRMLLNATTKGAMQ